MNQAQCFLCGRAATIERDTGRGFTLLVKCVSCPRYAIPQSLQEDLPSDPDFEGLRPYLIAHLHQNVSSARTWQEITEDWKDSARAHASTPVSQKVRMLLELIGRRTKTLGDEISIDESEIAPLVDARHDKEVRYLLQHLLALEYVMVNRRSIPSHERRTAAEEAVTVRMEVSGWEALSPVAGAGLPGTCFVAMSFDAALNDAYEKGIVAAVSGDCGFDVIRIDRVQHNEDITERILAGIRTAQFVVADFTGQRHGVYFEAGFAEGLGRTVIWACNERDFDQLHFDTRQRNHIKWRAPEDLRQQLTERVRATVTLPARFRK